MRPQRWKDCQATTNNHSEYADLQVNSSGRIIHQVECPILSPTLGKILDLQVGVEVNRQWCLFDFLI